MSESFNNQCKIEEEPSKSVRGGYINTIYIPIMLDFLYRRLLPDGSLTPLLSVLISFVLYSPFLFIGLSFGNIINNSPLGVLLSVFLYFFIFHFLFMCALKATPNKMMSFHKAIPHYCDGRFLSESEKESLKELDEKVYKAKIHFYMVNNKISRAAQMGSFSLSDLFDSCCDEKSPIIARLIFYGIFSILLTYSISSLYPIAWYIVFPLIYVVILIGIYKAGNMLFDKVEKEKRIAEEQYNMLKKEYENYAEIYTNRVFSKYGITYTGENEYTMMVNGKYIVSLMDNTLCTSFSLPKKFSSIIIKNRKNEDFFDENKGVDVSSLISSAKFNDMYSIYASDKHNIDVLLFLTPSVQLTFLQETDFSIESVEIEKDTSTIIVTIKKKIAKLEKFNIDIYDYSIGYVLNEIDSFVEDFSKYAVLFIDDYVLKTENSLSIIN